MQLHILIAGKKCADFSVHPAMVPEALRAIDARLEALEQRGRVAVTLDSMIDPNLTYILYPRSQRG